MGNPGTARRAGTQSIERTIRILKVICQRPSFGWQLADIASHCKFDKSTTHRILSCLTRERLIVQRPEDGHYLAGPMLFEFSLALPRTRGFHAMAAGRLTRLAKRTATVATLYMRSSDETVCALVVGDAATKNFMVVGDRRQLIETAGGLAMLLALPQREARSVIRRNLIALQHQGDERVKRFKAMYRSSKAAGMGIHESHKFRGNLGYGLPILDSPQVPVAAVVLSGSASELPRSRLPDVVALLREEVAFLSAQVSEDVGLTA